MTEKQVQAIYDDGYNKGNEDQVVRFRIGSIYANKHQIRDLRAVQAFVRRDEKFSLDYRKGYCDAIDRYVGVIEFGHDTDRVAIKNTVEDNDLLDTI